MFMRYSATIAGLLFVFAGILRPQEETYALRGRVVDDISSQGVPTARLQLAGGGLATPLVISSDNAGQFTFPGLRAGKYRLHIEKAGYFPQDYAREIEVGAGDISLGDVEFIAKRSISGTIQWRDGEPAAGAIVLAIKVLGGAFSPRPQSGLSTSTNDQGQFRLAELSPGRYTVYAFSQAIVSATQRPRASLPVFFPGTSIPDVSNTLDLRERRESPPISLVLEEAAGTTISGVVESTEITPPGTQVQLGLVVPNVPAQPVVRTNAKAGEAFLLPGVPPGSYDLTAYTFGSPQQIGAAAIPLVVSSSPIQDLRISIPSRAQIRGVVEVQASKPLTANPAVGLRLTGQSMKYPMMMAQLTKPADEKGEFEISAVFRGERYALGFSAVPKGFYVDSVKQANTELAAGRIWVLSTEDAGPIRIVLKDDGGTLAGTVRQNGSPAPRSFVVLAPKNREAVHRFLTANVLAGGTFSLTGIAPGTYDLFAFSRNDDDDYLDPQFLQRYSSRALVVDVAANSSPSFDLDLIALP